MRKKALLIALIFALALIVFPIKSNAVNLTYCFAQASALYRIPVSILESIASVESGFNPYALNVEGVPYFPKSFNGAQKIIKEHRGESIDVGIMQVNSFWFRKLGYPLRYGLIGCGDVYLGAYVLDRKIDRFGYNWKGIAAYHSADYTAGIDYADKVYAALAFFEKK